MLNQSEIKNIFNWILSKSSASETELIFVESELASTRFSNNAITQNLSKKNKTLSIKVIDQSRIGMAETNDFTESNLEKVLAKSILSAKLQKRDDGILPLADPEEYRNINHFDESTATLSAFDKADWIKMAVTKSKANNMLSAGIANNGWKTYAIANSKGLFDYHCLSEAHFNLSLQRGEASGWFEQTSYQHNNINVDYIIDKALYTALKTDNSIDIEPGNYTVILSPEALAELLYFLAFCGLNTQGIVEKTNFFHDKLGQKVFSELLSFSDDVYHPLTLGLPFDFEGVPRKKVNLIEKGVFTDMVLDRKLGKLLNKPSTGHSLSQPNASGPLPLNLVMEKGTSTMENMISSTSYGLYVNRFHYTNLLDPMTLNLTGMTRDGVFLIEKGAITKPVKNFRFTESIASAFNHIDAVEDKSTYIQAFFGGGFVVSGVKINQFHFSSKTEF